MTLKMGMARNAVLGFLTVMCGLSACDRLDDIADEIKKHHDGGGAPPPSCKVDSDCRAVADTCKACDCRALGRADADPVCGAGPGVQCFVDPCLNKSAVCDAGRCVIKAAPIACASTSSCPADATCSTEAGVCNRPPGCGPADICPAVCYGTCQPTNGGGGGACGKVTCAAGTTCCNASCGVCVPPGGACTQQACI